MSDEIKIPADGAVAPEAALRAADLEAFLGDIPVEVSVDLGRTKLSLREVIARLGPGSVIPLSKLTGERLDIRVNDRLVARGEAVAVGERYAVRITEVIGQKVSP